jgi:hypothetical protein
MALSTTTVENQMPDRERELLETEAQIEVLEAKLKRTKKPLGWERRRSAKQRIAELKARRQQLKGSR